MKLKHLLHAFFFLAVSLLTACGGGGGDTTAQPTTATLKLSTSGTLASGTSLAGIGISVVLPSGVTVKTNADGSVASGKVVVSGVAAPGSFAPPIYTPANGTTPAKLSFVMVSNASAGFGTGEFATVVCDIAAGSDPKTTDFTLADFKPVDLKGAAVSGLTANVTVTMQ